jgi:hypothetical protein
MLSVAATTRAPAARPAGFGAKAAAKGKPYRTSASVTTTRRVTAAAASDANYASSSLSSSSSPTNDNIEALLPPGYAYDVQTNRIADVGGTASFGIAMPNLRPLKEAKNEWLFSMKAGSVVLLGSTVTLVGFSLPGVRLVSW